jgi:hypothetical protein
LTEIVQPLAIVLRVNGSLPILRHLQDYSHRGG